MTNDLLLLMRRARDTETPNKSVKPSEVSGFVDTTQAERNMYVRHCSAACKRQTVLIIDSHKKASNMPEQQQLWSIVLVSVGE